MTMNSLKKAASFFLKSYFNKTRTQPQTINTIKAFIPTNLSLNSLNSPNKYFTRRIQNKESEECKEVSASSSTPPEIPTYAYHYDQALIFGRKNDYENALQHSIKAYELAKVEFGVKIVHAVDALSMIMYELSHLGRYEEALEKNEELQKITKGFSDDISCNGVMNEVYWKIEGGVLLFKWGKIEEGLMVFREVLGETGEVSVVRAGLYNHIAEVLFHQRKIKEAMENMSLASNVLDKMMLEDVECYYRLKTACISYELGTVYEGMGECDQARSRFEKTLGIVEKLQGWEIGNVPWMSMLPTKIAEMFMMIEGQDKQVIFYLEKGVMMLRREVDNGHKDLEIHVMNTLRILGDVYFKMGKMDMSEKIFLQGKEIADASFGLDEGLTRVLYGNLARTYQQMGRYSLAADLTREVNQAYERLGLTNDARWIMGCMNLKMLEELAKK